MLISTSHVLSSTNRVSSFTFVYPVLQTTYFALQMLCRALQTSVPSSSNCLPSSLNRVDLPLQTVYLVLNRVSSDTYRMPCSTNCIWFYKPCVQHHNCMKQHVFSLRRLVTHGTLGLARAPFLMRSSRAVSGCTV